MTKSAIINLIESNELLNKVDGFNSISLGTVMFVEDVGKQLANKSHMFHGIINSTFNEDGDLVITMPALKDRNEGPVADFDENDPLATCNGTDDDRNTCADGCKSCDKFTGKIPDIIKFEY
jgi:hypothetical protein